MTHRTILIVVGKDAPRAELAATLEALRPGSAHAVIVILGEMPVFPYYASGMPFYGTTGVPIEWQERVEALKSAVETKSDEAKTLLKEHGVSGEVATLICEPSRVAETIGRRAALCDLAMIGEDLRQSETLFQQIVYGILFDSPIGVVLNDAEGATLATPKRVFIAWNSHLSSARAAHLALPMLRQAEEVIVATVDPVKGEFGEGEDPGVDVATWLSHHGCTVTVQQYPSGGQSVGDCILDRARDAGAELIVMGSYGRSRTREALFGGTTRTLIEQTEQRVFLAH